MLRSDQIRHLDDALYRRYLDKLRVPTTNNSFINIADPYSMNDGWTLDITEWPNVTFGDIYVYLIDSPGVYTKESLKAYKSLDAYCYMSFVEAVHYNAIRPDCPVCILKSRVKPSQRMNDKPHEPWVAVDKQHGSIWLAHCTCKAG
jgi:hypothetical protein